MDRTCAFLSITFLFTSLSIVSCDVISMGTMIDWEDKSTNSIFDVLFRYNLYGCYCGLGGQGLPLDEIDRCCQVHDECYDQLARQKICSSGDAGVGMVYKYTKIDNNGQHTLQCKPSANPCAEKVCDCDKALADCFSSNKSSYNPAYRKYNRKELCSKTKAKGTLSRILPEFH